ncbi:hypothetical protein PybrP1_011907 [[Pythium] brassicae (nom. inval.)]|nr:hypothetical protein PybrP1_011907 [[Pythium] brassicae (nom. inval.)]
MTPVMCLRLQCERVGPVYTAEPAKHRWLAHHNAVFDVIWTFDDTQIVTASGDLLVCGWDVESQRAAFKLHGHQMSVKSVRQVPDHAYLFGSGARDGHVLLWDTRVSGKPVASLLNVHAAPESAAGGNPAAFASPPGARKRKKTSVSSSPRSVTCIEFGAHGHEIVTAGAVDSVVKFWDVRRLTTAHHFKPTAFASRPVRAFSCSSHTGAHHGISSLEFDATKSKLLVSVLNDAIKVVDVHAAPTADPILQCSGHLATSFYVKAAFSPESDFIIGGSADGAVFIWNASTARASATHPRFPSVALKAHTSEVNGVAWHKRDFSTVASCSDDGTARYWRVDRSDAGGAVDDTSVGRGRSSSKHFELRREDGRVWSNWSDFCAQRDGFAYAVSATTPCAVAGASMEAVADAGEEAKRKTPFLVRRSSELLRRREDAIRPSPPPPVRRPTPSPSPPQTLLDFWRR